MSTKTASPSVESLFESAGIESRTALFVLVFTGAAVVLLGSLFVLVASPAPGSLALVAVRNTMVGVVVGGFVGTAALLTASFASPWIGGMPDPAAVLSR